jgi:hypothetical protein
LTPVRWLADECVDAALVSRLRGAGHDVVYVAELASGISDTEVLQLAQSNGRVLLTEDKGFGELVFRSKLTVPGVVLLRIDPERHMPEVATAGRRNHSLSRSAGRQVFGDRGNTVPLAALFEGSDAIIPRCSSL